MTPWMCTNCDTLNPDTRTRCEACDHSLPTSAGRELARRAALVPGTLVYFDSMTQGRVKCKIIERRTDKFGADLLYLVVTGGSYGWAYPRGYEFTARISTAVQAR